jgi:hypothetical protein
LCIPVFSQKFQGIAESNYSGTIGLSNNPANVVDTRNSIFLNLSGIGLEFQSNYVRWNAPFSILAMATSNVPSQYINPNNGKIVMKDSYYKYNDKVNNVAAYLNGEFKGPAIMIDIKKWGVGVAGGVRYRYLNSISNSSPEIGYSLINGSRSTFLLGKTFKDMSLYFNSGFYNEFFGTLGKVIVTDSERMIKVGATAKYFISNNFGSVAARKFDYQLMPSTVNPGENQIEISNPTGNLSLASLYSSGSASNFTDQMVSLNGIGKGIGIDIGMVYEFRPDYQYFTRRRKNKSITDPTINKYKYKISLALIDIGFLKYSGNPPTVSSSNVDGINRTLNFGDFGQFSGVNGFVSDLQNIYDVRNSGSGVFRIFLPATSVAGFDYQLRKNVYLNLTWRQFLLPSGRRGIIGHSNINFTPRIEKKWFEIALPISLDNNFRNLNYGFAAKLGVIYFGSDNIGGLFNIFNPRGASVFAGAFIPLFHRLPESPLKCFPVNNSPSFRKKRFFK